MNSHPSRSLKIDVLVPVSKDSGLLTQTLESIASAREQFLLQGGEVNLFVQSATSSEDLDDQLNRFVYNECMDVIRVSSMQEFYDKAESDWLAVVDVGTFWTDFILTTLAPHFSESETMEAGIFYKREDFLKVMTVQAVLDGSSTGIETRGLNNADWKKAPLSFADRQPTRSHLQ